MHLLFGDIILFYIRDTKEDLNELWIDMENYVKMDKYPIQIDSPK